jgi:hypothetical protein
MKLASLGVLYGPEPVGSYTGKVPKYFAESPGYTRQASKNRRAGDHTLDYATDRHEAWNEAAAAPGNADLMG